MDLSPWLWSSPAPTIQYLGCSSGRSVGYEPYHRAPLWEASYSLWVRHLVLLLLKFISGLGSLLALTGSLKPSFPALFFTCDRALYSKSQTWHWCSEPFLCSAPFGWKNPPLILEKEYQAQSLPGVLAVKSKSMASKQNSSVMLLYNKTRQARRTLGFCLWSLDAAGWWCWETMVIHSVCFLLPREFTLQRSSVASWLHSLLLVHDISVPLLFFLHFFTSGRELWGPRRAWSQKIEGVWAPEWQSACPRLFEIVFCCTIPSFEAVCFSWLLQKWLQSFFLHPCGSECWSEKKTERTHMMMFSETYCSSRAPTCRLYFVGS